MKSSSLDNDSARKEFIGGSLALEPNPTGSGILNYGGGPIFQIANILLLLQSSREIVVTPDPGITHSCILSVLQHLALAFSRLVAPAAIFKPSRQK